MAAAAVTTITATAATTAAATTTAVVVDQSSAINTGRPNRDAHIFVAKIFIFLYNEKVNLPKGGQIYETNSQKLPW